MFLSSLYPCSDNDSQLHQLEVTLKLSTVPPWSQNYPSLLSDSLERRNDSKFASLFQARPASLKTQDRKSPLAATANGLWRRGDFEEIGDDFDFNDFKGKERYHGKGATLVKKKKAQQESAALKMHRQVVNTLKNKR